MKNKEKFSKEIVELACDGMLSVNQTFISKLSKEDIMNLFE